MTLKQVMGLVVWLDGGYVSKGPLWAAVNESQEYVHWFEKPAEPPRPRLKVVK